MKWCWHKWDKFVQKRFAVNNYDHIITKKKVCRKCGETRVKERLW